MGSSSATTFARGRFSRAQASPVVPAWTATVTPAWSSAEE